jgi:hypothetical protein
VPGAGTTGAAPGTAAATLVAAHPGDHHTVGSQSQADDGDTLIDLDDIDMDDLAVRLYDRLRSRLRRELLVDRERAGLLTDFR